MSESTAPAQARRPHYLWDLVHNGLSVAARLAAGVGVFVVLARWMGPAGFGDFMFKMASASLLAYFTVLGFTPMTLREVAAQPESARKFVDTVAGCKVSLTGGLLAVAMGLAWLLDLLDPVFFLLLVSLVMDGAVEWLFAVQKAQGHYDKESKFMTVTALGHAGLVLGVAWTSQSVTAVAAAFLVSRTIQFFAAAVSTQKAVGLPHPHFSWNGQRNMLRKSGVYATDVGLSVLTTQFDTVLVRVLYGAHTAGLYQAAMRVVIGLQSFSAVVGNVFLPRLSAALARAEEHAQGVIQLRKVYGSLAVVLAAAVLGIGYVLTRYGYGDQFRELGVLWPFLAILMAIRTWSAVYGVQLTAAGLQGFRTRINLLALVILVMGLGVGAWSDWSLVSVVGALLVSSLFVLWTYRQRTAHLSGGEERM